MADLYISASHVDGSSVSLMEALACGLPCVVSDIPANKEWVTDGVNGWIFPDGDVDALAEIILKAVEKRESLAQNQQKCPRDCREKRQIGSVILKNCLDAYEQTYSS